MTPAEQDKELRIEIARKVYSKPTPVGTMICGTPEVVIDEIYSEAPIVYEFARYITADRKRVALEAKIEALDYIIDLQTKQFNRWTQKDIANFFNDVGKYYRELKAQQEENKDE